MEVQVNKSNELTHWGVKGQKWGVRRWQNEDGTLTEEGKKHYMTAARSGKLDYKKLSDDDLNKINSRFARENNFKNNVKSYQESQFSYKLKQAVINRVTGNGGGGGGKKGGGSGIGKLLATPIKKAFDDAFKFDPGKGGGKDDDYSGYDDETLAAYKRWKKGGKFVESYQDDRSLRKIRKERGKRFLDSGSIDWSWEKDPKVENKWNQPGNKRKTGSRTAEDVVRSRHKSSSTPKVSTKPVVSVAAKKEKEWDRLSERAAKSGIIIAHRDTTRYKITRIKQNPDVHIG